MVKILFYLQNLLGTGHIHRCAKVVSGLAHRGFVVHLVLGGVPLPFLDFGPCTVHQLTPLRSSDLHFRDLITADGSPLSEAIRQERCRKLLQLAVAVRPDIVITESYPFGRRMMRFELLPLLQWAREQQPRPLLISSIRDILQRRRPEREQESLQIFCDYYDHVLVHGDPAFFPLSSSFPLMSGWEHLCGYTGYVTDVVQAVPLPATRRGVVVSVGGGAVGSALLRTAIELHASGFMREQPWTLLAGPYMPQPLFDDLQCGSSAGLEVLRYSTNFPELLRKNQVSVSMAGYNTVMDLLMAQIPAVLFPFEGEKETEQLMRAEHLAALGRVVLLREAELGPEALRKAIVVALLQKPLCPKMKTDGVRRTAELLSGWWQQKREKKEEQCGNLA